MWGTPRWGGRLPRRQRCRRGVGAALVCGVLRYTLPPQPRPPVASTDAPPCRARLQAIGSSLKGHLQASAEDLPLLQPLVPAAMEALAGLMEEAMPDVLAPLERLSGPIIDPKQLDKAINALYRECQAVTAGRKAPAAKAAPAPAPAVDAAAPSPAAGQGGGLSPLQSGGDPACL